MPGRFPPPSPYPTPGLRPGPRRVVRGAFCLGLCREFCAGPRGVLCAGPCRALRPGPRVVLRLGPLRGLRQRPGGGGPPPCGRVGGVAGRLTPPRPFPKPGLRPGPRLGLRPGPRLGLRLGPRLGLRPGPRLGLRPGPRLGLRPGSRLGLRPGLRLGLRRGTRRVMCPGPRLGLRLGPRLGLRPGLRRAFCHGPRRGLRPGLCGVLRPGVPGGPRGPCRGLRLGPCCGLRPCLGFLWVLRSGPRHVFHPGDGVSGAGLRPRSFMCWCGLGRRCLGARRGLGPGGGCHRVPPRWFRVVFASRAPVGEKPGLRSRAALRWSRADCLSSPRDFSITPRW